MSVDRVLSGDDRWTVVHGDCLTALRGMPDCSVDACVCDPPYEIGFMGRTWDRSGIAFRPDMWREVARVLKPGGHLLAFGGTRTWHRIACAIEDAGFDIRDSIAWVFAAGFPKSLDVSKAIDAAAGAEREVDAVTKRSTHGRVTAAGVDAVRCATCGNSRNGTSCKCPLPGPATEDAKRWQGFGTAVKPAHEPVIVARKPLGGTVAANVLKWGTGGLNIDGCRIGTSPEDARAMERCNTQGSGRMRGRNPVNSVINEKRSDVAAKPLDTTLGRFPANVCFDEATAAELDRQSGDRPGMSGGGIHRPDYKGGMFGKIDCPPKRGRRPGGFVNTGASRGDPFPCGPQYGDTGGASRFFFVARYGKDLDCVPFRFVAKASRSERDAGLHHFRALSGGEATGREDDSPGTQSPRAGQGRTGGARNHHATVKPVALLRYLVRLVTPPGGVVLDPFAGSGSCGVAAIQEGFRYVGIELNDSDEEPSVSVARARIAWAEGSEVVPRESLRDKAPPRQRSLFEEVES